MGFNVAQYLHYYIVFCWLLFIFWSIFCWLWHCLPFVSQLLITPLVSSNLSHQFVYCNIVLDISYRNELLYVNTTSSVSDNYWHILFIKLLSQVYHNNHHDIFQITKSPKNEIIVFVYLIYYYIRKHILITADLKVWNLTWLLSN